MLDQPLEAKRTLISSLKSHTKLQVHGQEIQISICLFETKILINEILQQLEAGAHLLPSAEYSKG